MTIAAQVVALAVLTAVSVGILLYTGFVAGKAWATRKETKLENHQ